MKDVYRMTSYHGYEMEWVYTSSHIAQTGVRLEGYLVRTFLSVEAARRWIDSQPFWQTEAMLKRKQKC